MQPQTVGTSPVAGRVRPPAVAGPAPAPGLREVPPPVSPPEAPAPLFLSLSAEEPRSLLPTRSATGAVSLLVHLAIGAAVVLVPLFLQDVLPPLSRDAVRAFLVEPEIMPPPPPPPPPPAAGLRPALRAPTPPPEVDPGRFVAPIEVPNEIAAPVVESFDLGVEGGVPGGVEGGVPGGVVGGVVGGLPQATLAPAEPPVVRVGGDLKAPRLVKDVKPDYPELALMARVSTIVFLEARVDTQGRVQEVKVLRGHPLFDDAAVGAVKQWRYQPLLLNGVPTPFVLTVTVHFRVTSPNH